MNYIYNDGGRVASGNIGEINDCVARAISIVSGPNAYDIARVMVEPLKDAEGVDVLSTAFMQIMHDIGFVYAQTPAGKFKISNLPKDGVYIAHAHNHVSAVIDGVINDTYDTSDEVLKGYWLRQSNYKGYNVFKGDKKLNGWAL